MNEQLTFAPGARILVRDEEWLVKATLPANVGGVAVRAVGLSELVRNHEALFLSQLDTIQELRPEETKLTHDESPQYRRTRLYLESLLRRTPPTDEGIYLGHRAAANYAAYQLQPTHMALQALRPRILIADSVGLGKTIEVGILLSELIKRGRGERILVVAIRSMLAQFQQEIWARFSIPLVRLDSVGLQRVRAKIPSNKNPFYYYDRCIISIDTLKNDAQYRHYLEESHWDVIVIDECHNVANAGSQRNRLASLLARTCDSLILTSATPHNGRAESFANLMNMLEPTAIADVSDYSAQEIQGLFVRRFKKDIEDEVGDQFSERKVELVRMTAGAAEEAYFNCLARARLHALGNRGGEDALFRIGLLKAFLSSPDAALESINGRLRRVTKRLKDLQGSPQGSRVGASVQEAGDAQLEAMQDAVDDLIEGDEAIDQEDAFELQPMLLGNREKRQQMVDTLRTDLATLTELRNLAARVDLSHFSKFRQLVTLLRRLKADASPKAPRLIIFSERITTVRFLQENLCREFGVGTDVVVQFHAGLPDVDQQKIVEDFGKEDAPVRILVASDVASEGVNLHYYCHLMVHFDIPWSLIRLEQRNGRIDRYGQKQAPIIHYLLTVSQNETIRGDLHILDRLIEKEQEAYKNIGDAATLLGLYDADKEEEYITRGVAEQKEAEQILPDTPLEQDPEKEWWLEIMADIDQTPPKEDLRGQWPSLYAGDLIFARSAFEELLDARQIERAPDYHPDRPEFDLLAPEDLRRRCAFLPDEAIPLQWTFTLTTDRSRVMQAIETARTRQGEWPRHQLFWDLHPAMDWLLDKLSIRFGRHETPVLQTQGIDPKESIVLCQGILSNRRSQPVISKWFGLLNDGEYGWTILSLDETLQYTSLDKGLSNPGNVAPARMDQLQALLPSAVTFAKEHMSELRGGRAASERQRLQADQRKLKQWLDTTERRIEAALASASGPRRARLLHEQNEARELFKGRQQWLTDTFTTDPTPYLRVAAVFTGR
jgi:superfamily II DNA or RNA helicase